MAPRALPLDHHRRQAALDRAAATRNDLRRHRLPHCRLELAHPRAHGVAAPAAPARATGGALKIPAYWEEATRELASRDPVLARLTNRGHALTLRSRGDAFSTLARAIVGQQISVKAAQ